MKINLLSVQKWLLCALLAFLATAAARAQEKAAPDKMPEFPGGQPALMQFLTSNLRYPEDAKKANAEGMVVVRFTVKADGSLKGIETAARNKNLRKDLAREAIRVVKKMPKWTPAEKNGKKVAAEMVLPIKFALN